MGILATTLLVVMVTAIDSTTGMPQGMRYIGCFVDIRSRDLPMMAGKHAMTPTKCYRLCRGKQYAYFGLQNAQECWCGNSYGGFGRRSNKECNMRCTGDNTALCGAGWRNNIYATGLRPRLAPGTKRVRYIGCFRDSKKRDLPVLAGTHAMSPAKCNVLCSGKHYAYFGVQHANECWCGNSYGLFGNGKRSKSECNMHCTGDKSKFCGGGWRNNVYATGHQRRTQARRMRYIGCFRDSKKRDLPKLAGTHTMSPAKCNVLCKHKGYAYFGLQFAKECWCGNSYGRLGRRSKSECNMHCTGDKSAVCGAGWRNSVYATGHHNNTHNN